MEPSKIDWGALMTSIMHHDDGRERLKAQWDACNEVIEHPNAYGPVPCDPFPPALRKLGASEIRAHSERAHEQSDSVGKNITTTFAAWRIHVTQVESANAARLVMLASTLRTLLDLRRKSSDPPRVDARIAALGDFIERAWGIPIPLTGELREWSVSVSRRYDLLPKDWREV